MYRILTNVKNCRLLTVNTLNHAKFVSNDTYRFPAVAGPSINEIHKISDKLNMRLSEEELKAYYEHLTNNLAMYETINKLTEPQFLPVKYPRTPGYKPDPEDNPYNAWTWKCEIKGASSGKLLGKTVAVKDNIAVAGVPMMNGSRMLEGYVPEYDATIVSRILDEGGILVGKSSVPDLCFSSGGYGTVNGPVDNPHKSGYNPGGSSSGSGALVAGGIVDLALGGDQGGSIRIPSCWCGIVGLKPTHGLVPYTGGISIEPSIDHLGPMTRTVYDCALLLEVIAGNDGMDPRQPNNIQVVEYTKQLIDNLKNLKIGIVKESLDLSDNDVAETVLTAAYKLKNCGALVEEISIPMHKFGCDILLVIIVEGGYSSMISGCGYGYGRKDVYSTSLINALHRGFKTHMFEAFPTVKATAILSEYIHTNYGNYFYGKAQNLARALAKKYNEALTKYDVLIMPTLTSKAPKIPMQNMKLPDLCTDALRSVSNTAPLNATGHPALTINSGFVDGSPIGMMIVGKYFDESTVLRVAYAFEKLK